MWDFVRPQLESVYTTGNAVSISNTLLFIQREDGNGDGQFEEHYLNWSMVPIRDAHGLIQGVFTPNFTITLLANRRLSVLEEFGRNISHSQTYQQLWYQAWESLSCSPANTELPYVAIYSAIDPDLDTSDESSAEPEQWTKAQIRRFEAIRRGDSSPPLDHLQLRTPKSASSLLPDTVSLEKNDTVTPASVILQNALLCVRNGENHVLFDAHDSSVLFQGSVSSWGDPITSSIAFPVRPGGGTQVDAVMVLALNTRSPMDDSYELFLEALAMSFGATLAVAKLYALKMEETQFRVWNEGAAEVGDPEGDWEYRRKVPADCEDLALWALGC